MEKKTETPDANEPRPKLIKAVFTGEVTYDDGSTNRCECHSSDCSCSFDEGNTGSLTANLALDNAD